MALVLDGRALATQIEADLLVRVEALKAKTGRTPILATILVGDDGASATYVRMKGNACRRVGMDSLKVELSKETTTEQLLAEIQKLNANPDVHGILLQHPVPEQIDERACFDAISLEKDVDGVTCLGFGRMSMGEAAYGSATPAGIMTILKETGARPEELCLELTERCRDLDVTFLKNEVNFFHSKGIKIALDDFGTGNSSLSLALELPVDELKVDMSFIKDIEQKPQNQAMVQSIVDYANRTNTETCIEGIENQEVSDYIHQFGATWYQGYFYSKPVPIDQFETLLDVPH